MSHLPTAEIAALAGCTKRQIQRLLTAGEIDGAERTPGGHWRVKDTPALRKWCRDFKRWDGKQVKPAARRKSKAVRSPSLPVAVDAKDAVKQAQMAIQTARDAIAAADQHARRAGLMLVEDAERMHARAKWYAHLAEIGIHPVDARNLMHHGRSGEGIDTPGLKRIGVMDKATDTSQERPAPAIDAGRWIGWVGNIRGWWTKTTRERPVEQWTDEERQAVRDQLAFIVEIAESLD